MWNRGKVKIIRDSLVEAESEWEQLMKKRDGSTRRMLR